MSFGFHLLSWRRHRGLTQLELAKKANTPRPYLSRLELDQVDPSLSLMRRLSMALNLPLGDLIEQLPTPRSLSNEELDETARGALRPGIKSSRTNQLIYARPLSRLLRERRTALGFHRPRRSNKMKKIPHAGVHVLRRLRADLGEEQWQALLKRVDKHAAFGPPPIK